MVNYIDIPLVEVRECQDTDPLSGGDGIISPFDVKRRPVGITESIGESGDGYPVGKIG
jgi:hypothetical protein